jgi:ketosteroid isomerase-like protein
MVFGPDGVRQFMLRFLEQFAWTTLEADRVQSVGDTLLVRVLQRGQGTTSGVEVEQRFFMLFTFRGDRIVVIESVWHEHEALEAVGLPG